MLGGPFRDLKYPSWETSGSVLAAKLIGSYEAELQCSIEHCLQTDYSDVLNIGCGDGYYAVGMARRLPKTKVHAFDCDPRAADQCRQMALINGVADRVNTHGACTPEILKAMECGPQVLIISDCEGAELDLLKLENLRFPSWDMIVECHVVGTIETWKIMAERFAQTHELTRLQTSSRDAVGYPPLANLSKGEQLIALSELRAGDMTWLMLRMRPRRPA